MAYTLEEVENHRFFKTLSKIDNVVNNLKKDVSLETVPQWHRFLAQYEFLKLNVESSEKIFIPNHVLGVGGGDLNTVYNHLDNYYGSKDVSQINAAIDNLSNTVENFNTVYRSGYKKAYSGSIDSFFKVLNTTLSGVDDRVVNLNKSVDSLSSEVRDQQQKVEKINASIADSVASVKNSIEKRVEAVESQANSRFDEFEKRFTDRESERASRFSEELESARKSISLAKNEIENFIQSEKNTIHSALKEALHDFDIDFNKIMFDTRGKHEEIKNLFEIVTSDTITGDFKKLVIQEKKSADLFRWISVSFMLISSIIMLAPYLLSIFGFGYFELSIDSVLARLPMSTLLLIPAGYAARESGKHRESEKSLRAMQTQMAALDPYLDSLPEEKRIEIKSILVNTYFVGSSEIRNGAPQNARNISIVEQVRDIVSAARP